MGSTIVAVASPPGAGRRGVIRLSGPRSRELVERTVRFEAEGALAERGARRGRFDDGVGTQPAIVLWMPAPHSYTREDVAELHLVGSPPLVAAALARLVALGAEPARAGEFTRRALENGRIDLTRAEGVLALFEAATEDERRSAAQLLLGGFAERIAALREDLVDLRALCEASLDFDESDTGHVPGSEIAELAAKARERLAEALTWETRRARATAAPRIALAGAPNAGKSTLFNRLTGARALVSDVPGTTRDSLRGKWTVHGVECDLLDTAGLSEVLAVLPDAEDPDRIAQRLARADHTGADVVLRLVDARDPAPEPLSNPRELLVRSQCDRPGAAASPRPGEVRVSAVRGDGLQELEDAVAVVLGLTGAPRAGSAGREMGERHLAALREARDRLDETLRRIAEGAPLDLVAEGLRGASDALDAIDGRTSPEDVLDRIFARFCIGK